MVSLCHICGPIMRLVPLLNWTNGKPFPFPSPTKSTIIPWLPFTIGFTIESLAKSILATHMTCVPFLRRNSLSTITLFNRKFSSISFWASLKNVDSLLSQLDKLNWSSFTLVILKICSSSFKAAYSNLLIISTSFLRGNNFVGLNPVSGYCLPICRLNISREDL